MNLLAIAVMHKDSLTETNALLLKDDDGHYSALYLSEGRVAHQFQLNFCPVVFPEQDYRVVKLVQRTEAFKYL